MEYSTQALLSTVLHNQLAPLGAYQRQQTQAPISTMHATPAPIPTFPPYLLQQPSNYYPHHFNLPHQPSNSHQFSNTSLTPEQLTAIFHLLCLQFNRQHHNQHQSFQAHHHQAHQHSQHNASNHHISNSNNTSSTLHASNVHHQNHHHHHHNGHTNYHHHHHHHTSNTNNINNQSHHHHHHHHHHGANGPRDDTMININDSKPKGLNKTEIEHLTNYIQTNEKDARSCVICLCRFELKSRIRSLPCSHVFHAKCVDKWLRLNRTCPICRRDAAKTVGYEGKVKRI